MAIRGGRPIRFTPKGLCDAYDATDAFLGACQLLSNLIFDQGNPEIVVSRPGVGAAATTFSGFTAPTFVSVYIVIGNIAYGMVASGRNAGKEEPFAYNIATNSFITVSGVTAANTPTAAPTSGPWTPPTMAVVSTKIIVTHPGFNGTGSNFFGVIDISNPAAPTWSSANLATNALPSAPTAVANFNNRAYFACGNLAIYSDVLAPTTRTNATQSLTIGDTTAITAFQGLPVQTTSAGVIGALVAFKGSQIWQVTGDTSTNNLGLNYITLTTGCIAPRSIVQGPYGIFFIGQDSPYILNFLGSLVPLTATPGADGVADLKVPFQAATEPSRITAAFAGSVYRVCVPTLIQGQQQTNDYWYDTRRKRWNGPHSFPYDCAAQYGNSFVLSSAAQGAALFVSATIPTSSSVYNDAGTALTSHLRSSSFPKTQRMAEIQVIESTIELSSSGQSVNYNISALDDQDTYIGSTFVQTIASGSVWGSFVWGAANWTSNKNVPHVYTIDWTAPLVFQKMALDVMATSSNSLSIGTFFARYQDTGYTNEG